MWRSRFLLPRLSCTIGCDIGARVHDSWKSSCAGSDGALVKPPRPPAGRCCCGGAPWLASSASQDAMTIRTTTAGRTDRIECSLEREPYLQLHRARILIARRHAEAGAARTRPRIDDGAARI